MEKIRKKKKKRKEKKEKKERKKEKKIKTWLFGEKSAKLQKKQQTTKWHFCFLLVVC